MSTFNTPGVYIKEIDAFPLSVAQVATAIPAFIGYTRKAPAIANTATANTDPNIVPQKIVSMLEFESIFGGPAPFQKFKLYESMQLFYANGGGECYIIPVGLTDNNGDLLPTPVPVTAYTMSKDNFIDGLAVLADIDEPTLILFPDAIELTADDLGEVQKQALLQSNTLMDRFVIMDVKEESTALTPTARVDADITEFRANIGDNNLKYGAAYYPSLTISWDLIAGTTTKTVPPSGAIAGIYAQTDATRGVWKAPANVSINGIIGLTANVTDAIQDGMNVDTDGKSVNAIRQFTGQGNLVWGARTLDGNSGDWKYINVRRLANTIEESIKKACRHYVFEPNVSQTWVSVKGMIVNYLTNVWSDGGLAGAKPEQAFFVSVGLNETMTAQDVLDGKMIVKVGYAAVRPAEFIIIEFKQMLQQS